MRPPTKRESVVTILGNYRLLSQLGKEPELFSLSEHLINMSEGAKSQLAQTTHYNFTFREAAIEADVARELLGRLCLRNQDLHRG